MLVAFKALLLQRHSDSRLEQELGEADIKVAVGTNEGGSEYGSAGW
jgi:hypothetical protein